MKAFSLLLLGRRSVVCAIGPRIGYYASTLLPGRTRLPILIPRGQSHFCSGLLPVPPPLPFGGDFHHIVTVVHPESAVNHDDVQTTFPCLGVTVTRVLPGVVWLVFAGLGVGDTQAQRHPSEDDCYSEITHSRLSCERKPKVCGNTPALLPRPRGYLGTFGQRRESLAAADVLYAVVIGILVTIGRDGVHSTDTALRIALRWPQRQQDQGRLRGSGVPLGKVSR
jgi:hypothetical protein